MPEDPKARKVKSPLISSFAIDDRTYERSLVDCGKENCSRCRTPYGRAASHGPYWYLCATRGGKWKRIYIGKNLKTDRYILPDGGIDWKTIDKMRVHVSKDNGPPASSTESPSPQATSAGDCPALEEFHKELSEQRTRSALPGPGPESEPSQEWLKDPT